METATVLVMTLALPPLLVLVHGGLLSGPVNPALHWQVVAPAAESLLSGQIVQGSSPKGPCEPTSQLHVDEAHCLLGHPGGEDWTRASTLALE